MCIVDKLNVCKLYIYGYYISHWVHNWLVYIKKINCQKYVKTRGASLYMSNSQTSTKMVLVAMVMEHHRTN